MTPIYHNNWCSVDSSGGPLKVPVPNSVPFPWPRMTGTRGGGQQQRPSYLSRSRSSLPNPWLKIRSSPQPMPPPWRNFYSSSEYSWKYFPPVIILLFLLLLRSQEICLCLLTFPSLPPAFGRWTAVLSLPGPPPHGRPWLTLPLHWELIDHLSHSIKCAPVPSALVFAVAAAISDLSVLGGHFRCNGAAAIRNKSG